MNISEPFIRRPIATSLLMGALALVGSERHRFDRLDDAIIAYEGALAIRADYTTPHGLCR